MTVYVLHKSDRRCRCQIQRSGCLSAMDLKIEQFHHCHHHPQFHQYHCGQFH